MSHLVSFVSENSDSRRSLFGALTLSVLNNVLNIKPFPTEFDSLRLHKTKSPEIRMILGDFVFASYFEAVIANRARAFIACCDEAIPLLNVKRGNGIAGPSLRSRYPWGWCAGEKQLLYTKQALQDRCG